MLCTYTYICINIYMYIYIYIYTYIYKQEPLKEFEGHKNNQQQHQAPRAFPMDTADKNDPGNIAMEQKR